MAMKCPSCGGFLEFNIESNKLVCPYCNSSFDPEQYSENNEGNVSSEETFESEENQTIRVDTYTCKNCGARLEAPEDQIVSYCMYCGGESVLMEKAAAIQKPEGIIPFKYDKEAVKKQYEKKIKSTPFAPKEFHKPEFIEGFRGIYIPYWKSSAVLRDEEVTLTGKTETSEGNTTITREYKYTLKTSGEVSGGAYDASEAFDDTIAENIAPFNENSIVPFNESYLAGFYADKATVKSSVYKEKETEDIYQNIEQQINQVSEGMETDSNLIKRKVKFSEYKNKAVLFPVWFLTWRNKNRVSYSVMNGETGKFSCDVPVDFTKFFLVTLIAAIIFSVIFCLIPSFVIPLKVAAYSGVLLFLSSFIFKSELKKINQLENHVYDLGSKQNRGKKSKSKNGFEIFLTVIQILAVIILASFGTILENWNEILIFTIVLVILQALLMVHQIIILKGIKNRRGFVTVFLSFAIQAAAFGICVTGLQADYLYYAASVLCLLGMIGNIITSVFYINDFATRPVPDFFRRKGAE